MLLSGCVYWGNREHSEFLGRVQELDAWQRTAPGSSEPFAARLRQQRTRLSVLP